MLALRLLATIYQASAARRGLGASDVFVTLLSLILGRIREVQLPGHSSKGQNRDLVRKVKPETVTRPGILADIRSLTAILERDGGSSRRESVVPCNLDHAQVSEVHPDSWAPGHLAAIPEGAVAMTRFVSCICIGSFVRRPCAIRKTAEL